MLKRSFREPDGRLGFLLDGLPVGIHESSLGSLLIANVWRDHCVVKKPMVVSCDTTCNQDSSNNNRGVVLGHCRVAIFEFGLV